jgi:hypothetical protein
VTPFVEQWWVVFSQIVEGVVGYKRARQFQFRNAGDLSVCYPAYNIDIYEPGGASYRWHISIFDGVEKVFDYQTELIAVMTALAYRFYRPTFRIGRGAKRLTSRRMP